MLLCVGAIVGVALAASSLVRAGSLEGSSALDEMAVATVDGRAIPRLRYDRALAAVAADRRNGVLAPGDRERVLDRLIEEELLVTRALELGLHTHDPRVRADLASSMIDSIKARSSAEPPEPAALRAFYESHPERFEGSPRFDVEHAFFSADSPDGEARANRAAGGRAPLSGDDGALPLPQGSLSLATLTQRLGPTTARGVSALAVGETGGPWRARGGWHVVRLISREVGDPPPFESIEAHVATEYERAEAETALRSFLDARRADAEIIIRASL